MSEPDRYSREGILACAQDFPFFRLIGLEIVDVCAGSSTVRIEHRHDLAQPAGIMHGGVIATLVDTGIAHALLMTQRFQDLREENGALVSIDLRVKFIRPVSEGVVECKSTVVRLGRTIIHAEAIVTDASEKEVARGDATYMAVPGSRLTRGS
ncbi:MAG TPA: PaaI family thioesterase [Longimicrobiales bacterium]|nr:PaaI family thioesterase [Longimicrobiales bacterium]